MPKRAKNENKAANSVPVKVRTPEAPLETKHSNEVDAAMEQRRKDDSNISSILDDGEACFQARKLDCAISSSNAALRIRDGDQRALSLRERARAEQARALDSITIR